MACCGSKRKEISNAADNQPAVNIRKKRTGSNPSRLTGNVYYEYTGRRGLIVVGSATRRRYFFAKQGTRLAVDNRDSQSLAGIPSLKSVRDALRN